MAKYFDIHPDKEWVSRAKFFSEFYKGGKGKLLDIGCHKAHLKKFLPKGIKYYGVNIDTFGKKHIIKCDLNKNKLSFRSNYFDFINAPAILEHLLQPHKMMEEISRVLKPGGFAIISLPNDDFIHNLYKAFFDPVRTYEQQIYSHHWKFTKETSEKFVKKYFRIIGSGYRYTMRKYRFLRYFGVHGEFIYKVKKKTR